MVQGQLYEYPPIVTSIRDFAKTMDKRPADMFYEYLEGPGIWVDDLEEFEREGVP